MKAVNPKNEQHPCLSPDNQKVVFSSGAGFDQDLYIQNLLTDEVSALTNNSYEDSHASWSPDGRWIVFQREDTMANRDLYIIRSDGSEEQNLTHTPQYREQHPRFSPDGTIIIFDANRNQTDLKADDHNYEIYTFNRENKVINRITTWEHWDMYPALSPDNSHIVWRRTISGEEPDNRNFEIFVRNLGTGEEWNLSENSAYDTNPHWNPSGNTIAFMSTRSGSFNLYSINSDGSHLQMLTQAEGKSIGFSMPAFSFDGSKIVANRYTKDVTDMVIIDLK